MSGQVLSCSEHVLITAGLAFGDTEERAVGLVCILDTKPRESFSQEERDALQELAKQASEILRERSVKRSRIRAVELSSQVSDTI